MKLIYRAHPFRVAFRKVVIYSYNMHSPACKCVEEYRKGGNDCLTFTCTHLCDFTFMKSNSPDKLNIIMHHIPQDLITSGYPTVTPKSFISFYCNAFPCSCKVSVVLLSSHFQNTILLKSSGSLFYYCKS